LLFDLGRHDESLAETRRAEELDPLSAFISANSVFRLTILGRHQEALLQGKKALELDPNLWLTHNWLAGVYWTLQKQSEAISSWEKAAALAGAYEHWPLTRLVEAYAVTGQTERALEAFSRLEQLSKQRYVEPVRLAFANAALGRKEEAIGLLYKASKKDDLGDVMWPQLERFLGEDPRFREIRERVRPALSSRSPRK